MADKAVFRERWIGDADGRRRLVLRGAASCFALTLLVCVPGCGQDGRLGQVRGRVSLDGKPLTKGTVLFVPEAGRSATGPIQSDGTFTMGTFGKSDGALIGPHKVAIIAYEAGNYDRPAYALPDEKTKPLVPQKYMSPSTSGLTADVKSGDNQLEFRLTSTE